MRAFVCVSVKEPNNTDDPAPNDLAPNNSAPDILDTSTTLGPDNSDAPAT